MIAHKRDTRTPMYEDLPPPVPISIPAGLMVAFRGDYVHGGLVMIITILEYLWV